MESLTWIHDDLDLFDLDLFWPEPTGQITIDEGTEEIVL